MDYVTGLEVKRTTVGGRLDTTIIRSANSG
jgi:hypothetical protein